MEKKGTIRLEFLRACLKVGYWAVFGTDHMHDHRIKQRGGVLPQPIRHLRSRSFKGVDRPVG
jgi:hypothetical protein